MLQDADIKAFIFQEWASLFTAASSLIGDPRAGPYVGTETFKSMFHQNLLSAQVIEPVRSRCLCIRIAAPTHDGICEMITHVGAEEGIEVPEELKNRLAKVSPFSGPEWTTSESVPRVAVLKLAVHVHVLYFSSKLF